MAELVAFLTRFPHDSRAVLQCAGEYSATVLHGESNHAHCIAVLREEGAVYGVLRIQRGGARDGDLGER